MLRAGVIILFSAAIAGPAARADTLASLEAEQEALFDQVAPAVAVISGPRTVGAAFAVGPGLLLTAAHVLGDARAVDVLLRDGRSVRGEVAERGADGVDVALVRIPADPAILPLAPEPRFRAGSVVATVGHPDGNRWAFGTGFVAQDGADAVDPRLVRLQVPLRPGASGGPVVDRHGRVIGVVTEGASGTVAFAVRSDAAVGALAGLRALAARSAASPPRIALASPAANPAPAAAAARE
jgi:S1-C subfamily serine protease